MGKDVARLAAHHGLRLPGRQARVPPGQPAGPLAVGRRLRVVHGVGPGHETACHGGELGHEPRRQDGETHDLDEADVLLLDVMPLLVGVEHAERVLVGGHVAAQREVGPVAVAHPVDDGRDGVVGHGARPGEDAHGGVVVGAPAVEHAAGGVEEGVAVVGLQADHRQGPAHHGAVHTRAPLHGEGLLDRRLHHGEHVAAALEVVVGQDGAAHHRQVGVGAEEVAGEPVQQVEEARHGGAVHVHGTVLPAHDDAVLAEVCIGAVLEAPRLALQRHGDDAQVLAGRVVAEGRGGRTAGIALVLHAELAGRVHVAVGGGGPCRGDVAGVLLGLGEVDGDLEVAPAGGRHPGHVAGDGRAAHVAGVAAEAVEPVGGGPRPLGGLDGAEGGVHDGGARDEPAHHGHGGAVAAAGGVLVEAVGHGDVGQAAEDRLEVEVALGQVALGQVGPAMGTAVGTHGLEQGVARPGPVRRVHEAAARGVVDQGADIGGKAHSHEALAPSSEMP